LATKAAPSRRSSGGRGGRRCGRLGLGRMPPRELGLVRGVAQLAVAVEDDLDALGAAQHGHADARAVALAHRPGRHLCAVLHPALALLALVPLARRLVGRDVVRDVVGELDPAQAEVAARLRVVLEVLRLDLAERAEVGVDGVAPGRRGEARDEDGGRRCRRRRAERVAVPLRGEEEEGRRQLVPPRATRGQGAKRTHIVADDGHLVHELRLLDLLRVDLDDGRTRPRVLGLVWDALAVPPVHDRLALLDRVAVEGRVVHGAEVLGLEGLVEEGRLLDDGGGRSRFRARGRRWRSCRWRWRVGSGGQVGRAHRRGGAVGPWLVAGGDGRRREGRPPHVARRGGLGRWAVARRAVEAVVCRGPIGRLRRVLAAARRRRPVVAVGARRGRTAARRR